MLRYFDKSFFLLAGVCFLSQLALGQITEQEDRRAWLKADKMFDAGNYVDAYPTYTRLIKLEEKNDEINFRLGVCIYESKAFSEDPLPYFEKVSPKWNFEVHYYLGILYHQIEKFDKAIHQFKQYNKVKDFKAWNEEEINYLKNKSEAAKLLQRRKNESIRLENLGGQVNSPFADYGPLLSPDERNLLFTSRRNNGLHSKTDANGNYFEDIYIATANSNSWNTATAMDTIINSSIHDACTGLSATGDKMLIFRTSGDLKNGNIFESKLTDAGWSKPELLITNVNSADNLETSACYSPDGNTIFFSSDRPGGFGGKDLYMVKVLPNGKWGEPFNLGSTVNTQYDEHAPFVDPHKNTLYFSSKGHLNMGGYDVFKSNYNDGGFFGAPENLGCPINSIDDDLFYVLNPDATEAYYASNRPEGFGSHDIYKVHLDPSKNLRVYTVLLADVAGSQITDAKITLKEIGTDKTVAIYKSNPKNGKLFFILTPGDQFQVVIEGNGYQVHTSEVIFTKELTLEFTLKEEIE